MSTCCAYVDVLSGSRTASVSSALSESLRPPGYSVILWTCHHSPHIMLRIWGSGAPTTMRWRSRLKAAQNASSRASERNTLRAGEDEASAVPEGIPRGPTIGRRHHTLFRALLKGQGFSDSGSLGSRRFSQGLRTALGLRACIAPSDVTARSMCSKP